MPGIPITVLGDQSQTGAYLLRMRITQSITVSFGRFNQGKAFSLGMADCLYVGSAMNGLAPRLIRHATRSGDKPPHPIRQQMLAYFPAINLGKSSRPAVSRKKLHWHIDYLLDQDQVELNHVILIRGQVPLERWLAHFLEQEPVTSILIEGLGATDSPGRTHLMNVYADETWWQQLPQHIMTRLSCG